MVVIAESGSWVSVWYLIFPCSMDLNNSLHWDTSWVLLLQKMHSFFGGSAAAARIPADLPVSFCNLCNSRNWFIKLKIPDVVAVPTPVVSSVARVFCSGVTGVCYNMQNSCRSTDRCLPSRLNAILAASRKIFGCLEATLYSGGFLIPKRKHLSASILVRFFHCSFSFAVKLTDES